MNKLNVLYEDNHIIVVEKQKNILSQSDNTKDIDMLSIVKEYIKEKYHKPGNVYLGLVHRLDRPVGGIMVFAKTSKAASRLSKQMKDNLFKKDYLAILNGNLKGKGTLTDKIKRKENGDSVISEDGKEAVLNYEVLDNKDNLTLVNISLLTGRHHQIRVQFASRGYPLCGDQRYGKQDKTPIALFAYGLSFEHPTTKEKLSFSLLPSGDWWTKFTLSNFVK